MAARSPIGWLALGLVLLAALAWIALRDAGPGADEVARPPSAVRQDAVAPRAGDPVALDSPVVEPPAARSPAGPEVQAAAGEGPTDAAFRGMLLRSSADLVLPYVELREHAALAVGGWRRIQREDSMDELRVLVMAPSELRAPGHLPAILEPGVEELVLEPDALLEIVAPELRERVASIEPWLVWPTEYRDRHASWGFVDATTWRFAVASDAPQVLFGAGIIVRARTGASLRVSFEHVTPGLRARCELPLTGPGEVAPLVVLVHGTADDLDGEPLRFEGQLYDRSAPRTLASYSWGRVMDYGQAKLEVESREPRLELADLPLGRTYSLRIRDSETGDTGSAERVHDGSPWRITLAGGLVLRARVVGEESQPLTTSVAVRWSWRAQVGAELAGRSDYVWQDRATRAQVEEGHLEVALAPGNSGHLNPSAFVRPEGLELRLLAPGCEVFVLERTVPLGKRELDVGTIELRSRPPELSLAPGAAGTEAIGVSAAEVGFIVLSGEVEGFYTVELAREGAGTLDVFLVPWAIRDHVEATGAKLVTSQRLVVLPPGASNLRAAAFERREDGLYRPATMRRHALRARVAADLSGQVSLGWTWGDFRHFTAQVAPGAEVELEFRTPLDAGLFWQSADESRGGELDPPDGFDLWLIP